MCVPRRPDSSGKCVYYMNRCNQRWFNQPLFGLTSRLASQAACRPLSLSSYFLSFFFFLPSPQNRMPVQPTLPWRQLQIQHPQPKMRSGTVSSRSVFLSQTSSSCSPFLSAFSFLFYSGSSSSLRWPSHPTLYYNYDCCYCDRLHATLS